jgi:hypothetical protein
MLHCQTLLFCAGLGPVSWNGENRAVPWDNRWVLTDRGWSAHWDRQKRTDGGWSAHWDRQKLTDGDWSVHWDRQKRTDGGWLVHWDRQKVTDGGWAVHWDRQKLTDRGWRTLCGYSRGPELTGRPWRPWLRWKWGWTGRSWRPWLRWTGSHSSGHGPTSPGKISTLFLGPLERVSTLQWVQCTWN